MGSSSTRPDHSSVPIATAAPVLPPSAVPIVDEKLAPSAYDSSYSDPSRADDRELLLEKASASGSFKGHSQAQGLTGTQVLLLFLITIAGLVFLLNRLSVSPRDHLSYHLSPYLPATFIAFLGSTGISNKAPHPILPLLDEANAKWAGMLASQSTTFDRATKQYKARYSLSPPPGFDKWFAFATQGRNHTLVDEYDGLMEDLLPFRSLTPAELRRRTAELAQIPGISIVSIRDGAAQVHSKSGKWAPAYAFQQMLGAFVHDLPDMDIAINEKPEGRVLPRCHRIVSMEDYGLDNSEDFFHKADDEFSRPSLANFTAEWGRDGSVWETFRRSCPTNSAARRLVESVRSAETSGSELQVQGLSSLKGPVATKRRNVATFFPPTREFTFNPYTEAAVDFCSRPSMHSLHSAFFSDQRSINHLYPVFSPSKPGGFADILIPSHHYWSLSSEYTYEWEMKRGRTKEPTDPEWSLKKPSIYWRGKVTKGADTPPGRSSSFQKQRFVKLANQATPHSKRILVSFDPNTAGLSSSSVPRGQANRAMSDVAMACDPNLGECSYLHSLGYRVEPPGPLSDAWKHKYVLDLDEIGFSPRFLALMESKSAVIKSSVQREFWSGWAVPWKHFIPLSSAYSELYNIQTFFTGFPNFVGLTNATVPRILTAPKPVPVLPTRANGQPFEGDAALRDIAEAGSEWRLKHVRKQDMECYVYRLMVEWAAMVTGDTEE